MRGAVLVWSRLARRSRDLALRHGLKLHHIGDKPPYLKAWKLTPRILRELGPESCVILQLPPGPAVYRATSVNPRPRILCDVHTGMIYYRSFREVLLNKPFVRYLRRCDSILAHNEDMKNLISAKLNTSNVEVIYDPLPQVKRTREYSGLEFNEYIIAPVSWDPDENISVLVDAFIEFARTREGIGLVVTGDYTKRRGLYRRLTRSIETAGLSGRVLFTGFISYEEYLYLVEKSMLMVALTNWEYTILSAVWEAALYDVPIVYPSTRTLRGLFRTIDPQGFLSYTVDDHESLARTLERAVERESYTRELGARMGSYLRGLSESSMERLAGLCSR